MPSTDPIRWRLHTCSDCESVYRMLDTDSGRRSFWAETAMERDGVIQFEFINGMRYEATVLEREPGHRWKTDYFDTVAEFVLDPADDGGTDLTLSNFGVHPHDRCEVSAGWLNVLLPLKAAVDHGIDLGSHHPTRTWDIGFVDR